MGDHVDGRTLRYQHRRGELLEAVAEYVLENGLASLSLRRVAEAVGVSHVTLQHHFGSKEQLVGEIVEHLLERTFMPQEVYPDGAPEPGLDLATRWRAVWAGLTSAQGQRDIRLFVEVLGQSQLEGTDYAPAVKRSINRRIELVATNAIALGCPEEDAHAFATLGAATLRGLVIDLLATGERERVDRAFEGALENVLRRAEEWDTRARQAGSAPVLAGSQLAGSQLAG